MFGDTIKCHHCMQCVVERGMIMTEMCTTLLDLGADARMTTSSGDTVLHTAVSEGAIAALEVFVAYCNSSAVAVHLAEPLIAQQDYRGYTPLHTAVLKRRGEAEPIDMLRVLLSSRDSHLAAALVKQDETGRTVLHMAVKLRLMDEVQLLVAACHKVEVLQSVLHMRDNKDQTLVALARCMRGDALVSVLAPYCEEV
jgi:ankyrin repeat protein